MTLTEHLDLNGSWKLPGANRKVGGQLVSNQEGIRLELYRALSPVPGGNSGLSTGNPEWKVLPVIHGVTREGVEVTLLNSAGLTGPVEDFAETYDVEAVVVGATIARDEFTEVAADFDWLDAWLNPPALTVEFESSTVTRIQESQIVSAVCSVEEDTIRLIGGTLDSYTDTIVQIERYSQLAVKTPAPRAWEHILETRIRPFQELLAVAIGRPVTLTRLSALICEPGGKPQPCELHFNMLHPQLSDAPNVGALLGYGAAALVRFEDLPEPRNVTIGRWYEVWETYRPVLTLMMAPYNAPFIYGQHRFGVYFQAVEAWHGIKHEGKELGRSDHLVRVKSVVDAARSAGVNPDTVAWADRVLRARNDKRLSDRIEEVVQSTGAVGEQILSVSPNFGQRVAGTRAGVAHPGDDASDGYPAMLHWYGDALLWVLRACLLAEIGIDDIASRVTHRARFQHCIARLAELSNDDA